MTRALIGLFLVLSLCACRSDRALVEKIDQDRWQPAPFELSSMGGQRAADRVTFVLRLSGPEGRRLTVEGTVKIDPQATLVQGDWTQDGGDDDDGPAAGPVSSAVMEFFGGQGGRPSLGGQMTLSANGTPRYRINLPTTELTVER